VSTEENFSSRLKSARSRLGLTQLQFAAMLRVSRNYLNMLENGREPGEKFLADFDAMESAGRFDSTLREESPTYQGTVRTSSHGLLHRCEGMLEALHAARTLDALKFGIDAFEREWSRYKYEALATTACAPIKTSVDSTTTVPASSPPTMESVNIVKLPAQHLTSKSSLPVPSKTKRG